ncbi:Imm50 family immunity protein [Hymenobacter psychrophilus]|uniref:Imm50 family immunity protein n=1 Tax=Hymenobacter psychrophilus TaxID=651662 RepID=UPI000B8954A0|nr:Imm50 family immunity protein [Hymenobacter psychrophilus]
MWFKLASNPEVVESIYGDEIPILEGVLLHEMEFRLDGGSIILLRFGPSNYPSKPPAKWVSRGNNTASISLQLIDVSSTTLEGRGIVPQTFCDFSFKREDESLIFEIKADNIQAKVKFGYLYIDGITAYRGKVE